MSLLFSLAVAAILITSAGFAAARYERYYYRTHDRRPGDHK